MTKILIRLISFGCAVVIVFFLACGIVYILKDIPFSISILTAFSLGFLLGVLISKIEHVHFNNKQKG